MKAQKLILPLTVLFLFTSFTLFGQKWNKQQQEVWNTVETYNEAHKSGDVDKFMSFFHEDYMGWYYGAPIPSNKATTRKYVELGMKGKDVIFSNLTPLTIQVFDDIAIVNYMFHVISTRNGETNNTSGRWTDILKKENGKWILIADHGGDKQS